MGNWRYGSTPTKLGSPKTQGKQWSSPPPHPHPQHTDIKYWRMESQEGQSSVGVKFIEEDYFLLCSMCSTWFFACKVIAVVKPKLNFIVKCDNECCLLRQLMYTISITDSFVRSVYPWIIIILRERTVYST